MFKLKKVLKLVTTFSSIFFIATSICATDVTPELRAVEQQENYKPHFGFSAGIGSPEGELNVGGNYAIEIGYQPIIPLGLGFEYSIANYEDEGANKLVRNSFLVKGSYNFGGKTSLVRYAYVGLGIGAMWEDTNLDDRWAMAIMPNIGFDYPIEGLLESPISIGLNGSHLYASSDNPDVFAMSGVVKYWY